MQQLWVNYIDKDLEGVYQVRPGIIRSRKEVSYSDCQPPVQKLKALHHRLQDLRNYVLTPPSINEIMDTGADLDEVSSLPLPTCSQSVFSGYHRAPKQRKMTQYLEVGPVDIAYY